MRCSASLSPSLCCRADECGASLSICCSVWVASGCPHNFARQHLPHRQGDAVTLPCISLHCKPRNKHSGRSAPLFFSHPSSDPFLAFWLQRCSEVSFPPMHFFSCGLMHAVEQALCPDATAGPGYAVAECRGNRAAMQQTQIPISPLVTRHCCGGLSAPPFL